MYFKIRILNIYIFFYKSLTKSQYKPPFYIRKNSIFLSKFYSLLFINWIHIFKTNFNQCLHSQIGSYLALFPLTMPDIQDSSKT